MSDKEISRRDYFIGKAMQVVKPPIFYVNQAQTKESITDYADKCIQIAQEIMRKTSNQ